MMQRGKRPGVALLEVLVALTILGTAGSAFVGVAIQSARAAQLAHDEERRMSAASDFLDKVSLWEREDLDRRLGDRPEGQWRLRVNRTLPDIYDVTLTDSTGARLLLRTSLYRPDSSALISVGLHAQR